MVAKGHHFPGVELAAVVDADTGLALPDFRAEERTFQLVTQLAGRSGRDAPGLVLVQTFQPDAARFAAARHDVAGFLGGRARALSRARLSAVPASSRSSWRTRAGGARPCPSRAAWRDSKGWGRSCSARAPLLRIRGRYRAQLLAKTHEPRRIAARAAALLAAATPCPAPRRAQRGGRRRPSVVGLIRADTLAAMEEHEHVAGQVVEHDDAERDAEREPGASSRWRRSGNTATPCCVCGRSRWRASTTSCAARVNA